MSAVEFGQRSTFAIGLTWYPCSDLGDPANSQTWCEFELWAGGQVLTRHVRQGNEYLGLVVPAAPIAAWMGASWSALVSEERLPDAGKSSCFHAFVNDLDEEEFDDVFPELDAFLETHALERVPGGLLLPDVVFWRRGDVVDVSWRSGTQGTDERQVTFVGSGQARIEAPAFFDALRGFVRAVNERARRAPESSFLRGEVESALRRVTTLDEPHLLAARFGRDPDEFVSWLRAHTKQQERLDALADAYGVEVREARTLETIDTPLARAARSAGPAFSPDDHSRLIALGRKLRTLPVAKKLVDLR